ncbi:MAG TPA: hypothetical protein VGM75_37015 [Pseudonocardiaceae bacterium]
MNGKTTDGTRQAAHRGVVDRYLPWRARRRRQTDRAVVECAFERPGQDHDDALPSALLKGFPGIDRAVLFTARSLVRHGYSARDLSRVLTLTDEQSAAVVALLRSLATGTTDAAGAPSEGKSATDTQFGRGHP